MTDINKLIEEYTIDDFERMAMETDYAVEASEDTCKINEADAGAFYKEGFKAGASFILHQNRWRKVEEELPEAKEVKYQILIRIINIPTSATVWNIRNESDLDIIRKMTNSEWKPIT